MSISVRGANQGRRRSRWRRARRCFTRDVVPAVLGAYALIVSGVTRCGTSTRPLPERGWLRFGTWGVRNLDQVARAKGVAEVCVLEGDFPLPPRRREGG